MSDKPPISDAAFGEAFAWAMQGRKIPSTMFWKEDENGVVHLVGDDGVTHWVMSREAFDKFRSFDK